MTRTVLLVGANRGIGLNLARALAARDWDVVGSVRPVTRAAGDPSTKDLEAVTSRIIEIDLGDEKTVIQAAGLGPEPDNWYDHSPEILLEKFRINTVGAFMTPKHCHPNLKKAGGTIINILSNAGSIGLNKGEDLAYGMSKAALNMMTVTMSKEFQQNGDNIAVLAFDRGYVATRMTNGQFRDDMEECIERMAEIFGSVGMEQTGQFLDWRGGTLPW